MAPSLKRLVPAAVRRTLRHTFGWKWLKGDYPNWAAARAASSGYDSADPLGAATRAARLVRTGQGLWDRDGAVFQKAGPASPLLESLLQVAARNGGNLRVIDVGGGLGSTHWQHREALDRLPTLIWRIVEQPGYLAAGRAEFAAGPVSFHATLAEALGAGPVDVILLSSVLPYVEEPLALLAQVQAINPPSIILDRMPWKRKGPTRLAVQSVPPSLGGGSYPCWVFERQAILGPLATAYRVEREWPGFDDLAAWVTYTGLHLSR